jgi:hypothetical protein
LAQTCRDLGKFDASIKYYTRRIELGGWVEEVYYSYLQIARCFIALNKPNDAEIWALKGHYYRPSRPEVIYFLACYYRASKQYQLSMYYSTIGINLPPSDDVLFVEKMDGKFEFEQAMCHYLASPTDRVQGLKNIVKYFNSGSVINAGSVVDVMYNYVQRLGDYGSVVSMNYPVLEVDGLKYNPSSPSIINCSNNLGSSSFIVNVRYVNYILNDKFQYEWSGKHIRTINGFHYADERLHPIGGISLINTITETPLSLTDGSSHILGLEDVRLFHYQNKIHYVATSRQFSNVNRMCMGEYDMTTMTHIGNHILHPPTNTNCEKNWIPVVKGGNNEKEELLFIYGWHPLQLGRLNDKDQLEITITRQTPRFFNNFRGSSTPVLYQNKLYLITHGVKYKPGNTRDYYHQLITLDPITFDVIDYTIPFYFNNFTIEYCIGMAIIDHTAHIMFSHCDRSPSILKVSVNVFDLLMVK